MRSSVTAVAARHVGRVTTGGRVAVLSTWTAAGVPCGGTAGGIHRVAVRPNGAQVSEVRVLYVPPFCSGARISWPPLSHLCALVNPHDGRVTELRKEGE